MPRRLDWAHAFEQTRLRFHRDIEAARLRGQTTFQFGDSGRIVDPTRLSSDKVARLAREHAARTTELSINKYNEQIARKGR